MSYQVLDSTVQPLVGLKKAPKGNNIRQMTAARRGNVTVSLMPFPTWAFEADLLATGTQGLATSQLALFQGLYIATNCGASLWLFNDVTDNSVTTANSGMLNVSSGAATPMGLTGDGSSTQFQLARSIGGLGWDVIQNLNGSPSIYVNGSLKTPVTDYSVSSTGVVTFTSAPASGATLTWSGDFYFLCRFTEDTLDSLAAIGFSSSATVWQVGSVKWETEFL